MTHNGKRLQINTSDVRTGDYPFINLLKTGREWTKTTGGAPVDRSILDSNGYPTSIVSGGVHTQFNGPSQTDRPGNWVIKWDGNLTCSPSGATLVSGSLSGLNGRAIVTPGASGGCDFFITALGSPTGNNIRICHVDDEALLDAGEIFSPLYLSYMAQFGVVRDLGWGDSNFSTIVKWSDRKPITYWSYSEDRFPVEWLAGTCTSSGDTFSAALSGYVLADKSRAIVSFDKDQPSNTITAITRGNPTVLTVGANTFIVGQKVALVGVGGTTQINGTKQTISAADATTISLSVDSTAYGAFTSGGTATTVMYLNVGATGAKEILDRNGRVRMSAQFMDTPLKGGFLSICTYDSALDGYLVSNANGTSRGLHQMVPPEVFVSLCNKVNAHPWVCAHFLSCDPISDYTSSYATYMAANLNSGLVPFFEGVNEEWNFSFNGTNYAFLRETLRNGALNSIQAYCTWYGRTLSAIGQAVDTVYGGDRSRYNIVCACQAFGGTGADVQLRLTTSSASTYVTHISFANYWNAGYYGGGTETTLAATYAGGGAAAATALESYVRSSVLSGTYSLPAIQTIGQAFYALCVTYNKKLCFYEGGYSPDYTGTAEVNSLRAASKGHTLLTKYEGINLQNMVGLGSRSEYPSFLSVAGSNAWSIFDPNIYDTPQSRWTAVELFNARKRRIELMAS